MDLLELGIAAARTGNRAEARMYLEAVTLAEPDNTQAFMWLSYVLEDRKLALRCLERVLEIEPDNEQAKKGLAWLRQQQSAQGLPLPPQLADEDFSRLVQLLEHPDAKIVIKAVRYLGQAGGARAVEPLISLLASTPSQVVQAEARTALIAIGTPSVDPVFQRLMSETNPAVINQLAAVLARVRSIAALEACREVIARANHPAARYAMVLNLTASVHSQAALSIVRDYVLDRNQDPRVRAAILTAVGQAVKTQSLDADQGVGLLMEMQIEQAVPASLRQAALIALGISNHPSAARYLSMAVSDHDPQMRAAAVEALGRFTPPQVELLSKLARSGDQIVRARAQQVLKQLGASSTKPLAGKP